MLTPKNLSENSSKILQKARELGIEEVLVYSMNTELEMVQGFIIDSNNDIRTQSEIEFQNFLKDTFNDSGIMVSQTKGFDPDFYPAHRIAFDSAIYIEEINPNRSFAEQFKEQEQKSIQKRTEEQSLMTKDPKNLGINLEPISHHEATPGHSSSDDEMVQVPKKIVEKYQQENMVLREALVEELGAEKAEKVITEKMSKFKTSSPSTEISQAKSSTISSDKKFTGHAPE